MAVLRMLQEGASLSLELAQAITDSVLGTLVGIFEPFSASADVDLAFALGFLRAAEIPALTKTLLGTALSLLGMRALMMPWVREAAAHLVLGGHRSQARASSI